MALIKKIDVKTYLSSRKRNGFRPYRQISQPDATGFSGEPSACVDSNTQKMIEETLKRPYASRQEDSLAKTGRGASNSAATTDSKSAQA